MQLLLIFCYAIVAFAVAFVGVLAAFEVNFIIDNITSCSSPWFCFLLLIMVLAYLLLPLSAA